MTQDEIAEIGPTMKITYAVFQLGPVPETGLVSPGEAARLIQERWPDVPQDRARELVTDWWREHYSDTTHTWMQAQKIVRQRFLQWVERNLTDNDRP